MSIPRVHLICNAHLDPVWQWRWEEGCAAALATFRTAVQLLHEDRHFVFNHNESVLYRWVEEYDPRLFDEIQQLVRAGRWSISGGWYLQPDANLPGLESFIRHISEGRRYFQQRFGVKPRVAYNFDSFGHHGGLPQILRRAGYDMYIHMRPQQDDFALPSDLYRWRGVDGSEILTLRITVGLYLTERDNLDSRLREGAALAVKLNRDVPLFWGLGDHGGGATAPISRSSTRRSSGKTKLNSFTVHRIASTRRCKAPRPKRRSSKAISNASLPVAIHRCRGSSGAPARALHDSPNVRHSDWQAGGDTDSLTRAKRSMPPGATICSTTFTTSYRAVVPNRPKEMPWTSTAVCPNRCGDSAWAPRCRPARTVPTRPLCR